MRFDIRMYKDEMEALSNSEMLCDASCSFTKKKRMKDVLRTMSWVDGAGCLSDRGVSGTRSMGVRAPLSELWEAINSKILQT